MIDLFKDKYAAHDHSLRVLDLIYCYDSFLDSISTVADMGCGAGMDAKWWATCETRDDPPLPHNYTVYAVDKNLAKFRKEEMPKNAIPIEDNFETVTLPRKVDLLWCHDSFQFAINPVATLQNFNRNMNKNGMLVLVLPQMTSYINNRLLTRSYNQVYFSHNVVTLLYMLGVTGFDCKDMYVFKNTCDPWIHIVTYKNSDATMDPATTSWYDLIENDMVHPSIAQSVERFGYVKQEDLMLPWIDKNFYWVQD